ncbi:MAG: polyphosphate:AMP phosphotransferase [Phascolarctobacterium sp.]
MLEKLDMKRKLSKGDYNAVMDELGERLGQVQRMAREAKKPIIIVFEGWRGARRSAIINTMMQQMDARGFNVYSTVRMSEEEHKQPFFTFFWQHLPALGNIAVYHRSWYYLKNANEGASKEGNASCCQFISNDHINQFEKMLTDDNYIILKYFLHLSKDQQKENIAKNAKTLGKAWRDVSPAIDESDKYDEYLERYEKMLEATDKVNAPWHLIAADDRRSAEIEIITSIVDTVEKAISTPVAAPAAVIRPNTKYDVLGKINATQELSKEDYKKELDKYQKRLKQLQIEMFKAQIPTVICFEGWDAAGKGGAIRRLTAALDPLGFSVHPVSAPNVVERQFHYLWRFWVHLPEPGNIAIFDRTWYGRVMVERIEGFAKDYEWQRAYDEIKDMELQWAEHGFAIAKFWLQIDKDEQLRRFNDRQNDPMKQWKITDEDWRNREKWDAYEEAVNEMLVRTDTSYAPWTVVEGNNKYFARLKVVKTIVDLFEKKLGK